ncbi:MAG: sulfatase-like hydrolase/transferase [Verrucomicrobiales bacterium]|nr:sulfatase-like hydrolase/transferase [Verrucomicrobiales bacterium]
MKSHPILSPYRRIAAPRWFATLAALLVGLAAPPKADAAPRPPNIVVIIADDLGYADIGANGGGEIPTPHIDALARDGLRLTSGYVSGPYCSPTRAGFLTGRYQQRFGHEFNPGGPNATNALAIGLSPRETTLAERLRKAGYATGLVGKWHLGYSEEYQPQNRGFEETFGFLGGAHSYTNLDQNGPDPIRRNGKPVQEKQHLTEAFTREAVAFIERHRDRPFFLTLAYNGVHNPLEPSPTTADRASGIADPRRRAFAGLLIGVDDGVGAVTRKLAEAGLDRDTLLVFFSDNGGPTNGNTSRNDPFRGFKAQTWEGGIRVPFLVRWPGRLPAGKTFDRPVIQLDVHATALAAAGIEIRPEWKLDGVNLLPHLSGEVTTPPHDALYWRFGRQIAIRQGDWKLVQAGTNAAPSLYDLSKDPGETRDLSANEPRKVASLQQAWNVWNQGLVPPSWNPPRNPANTAAAATRDDRTRPAPVRDGSGALPATSAIPASR